MKILKSAIFRRAAMLALCASLLLGTLALGASAASVQKVTAYLRPDYTILIDGISREFYNVSGTEVHPLVYSGSTYLPVRAIGELMGKNVDWNQSTKTVTLAGARTTGNVIGRTDTDAVRETVTAELHPDFTIVVDGTARTFRDVDGDQVYPLLYRGSTYLPLRAIGELMGKTVDWDNATKTVIMNGDSQVTDADSFSDGTSGSVTVPDTTTPAGLISETEARNAALAHAGLQASQVTFIQSRLEWEDGRRVYDVEFYTSDYKEYDYEIDAATGRVLDVDYDAEHYVPSGSGSAGRITEAEAKNTALAHAGLQASQVTFVKVYLDWDDGRQVYDVEFYTSDYKEYDYEIDAATGRVLSFDYDADYYTPPVSGSVIGESRAREIALGQVPGASASHIRKLKLDRDDGRQIYEVEIVYNAREYEFDIDAVSGVILSSESESIYD